MHIKIICINIFFKTQAAPTSGLKDDDFNTPGKINTVPLTDFDMSEYEDKPWR